MLDAWKVSYSKIITWINNSIGNSINIQLTKYETVKKKNWEHFKKLYTLIIDEV